MASRRMFVLSCPLTDPMNIERPFVSVRSSIGDGLRFSTCSTTDFAASALEITSPLVGPLPIVAQATDTTAAAASATHELSA